MHGVCRSAYKGKGEQGRHVPNGDSHGVTVNRATDWAILVVTNERLEEVHACPNTGEEHNDLMCQVVHGRRPEVKVLFGPGKLSPVVDSCDGSIAHGNQTQALFIGTLGCEFLRSIEIGAEDSVTQLLNFGTSERMQEISLLDIVDQVGECDQAIDNDRK